MIFDNVGCDPTHAAGVVSFQRRSLPLVIDTDNPVVLALTKLPDALRFELVALPAAVE
jgi:hypothetical protein